MSLGSRIAKLEVRAPSRQHWFCIVGAAIPEAALRRRLRADGVPADAELVIDVMAETNRYLREKGYDVDALSPEQEGRIVARPYTPTASGDVPFETLVLAMADWRRGE